MFRRLALSGILLAACDSPASAPSATAAAPSASVAVAVVASAAPAASAAPSCANNNYGLAKEKEPEINDRFEKKRGTMGTASKRMVATSHKLATEAGLSVLRAGGNAADAFVAAALAQDVVLPGVTSTAGLAGILVYSTKTKKVTYIHGGLADPIEQAHRYKAGDPVGRQVLVPGAPAAYAELVKQFGAKPLATDVEPAAKLAIDGFPLDSLYANAIVGHRKKLEASRQALVTFFSNGKPIAEGEVLKQHALGATLRLYGKDPTFFYKGQWALDALKVTDATGGILDAQDFATYAVESTEANHTTFGKYEVYGGGQGGEHTLASLGALAQLRGTAKAEAPFESAAAAETMLRILDANIQNEGADASTVEKIVRAGGPRRTTPGTGGTHSSSVVVVDDQGNVVVGTHTIETLNWGEGLFVGGVPLSTAAPGTPPGPTRMRRDPLSDTIVMKDGAPVAALAVYGTGLFPADVQVLDAVLSRGKNAEDAVLEPRLAYYAFDVAHMRLDMAKNSVDPRFSPALLCALEQRGFKTERSSAALPPGIVDTGFPTLVTIAPGHLEGMTPDPFFIHGVAAGD